MHGLPSLEALSRILGTDCLDLLLQLLDASLIVPARNQMQYERKQLRSHLLRLGYELVRNRRLNEEAGACSEGAEEAHETRLYKACEAIELLHEGSLMIDDIQDSSPI